MRRKRRLWSVWAALCVMAAAAASGQGNDDLIGVWSRDEGFQIVELLFRSDGRYQLDTQSTDPASDFSFTERGRYSVEGQTLTLLPYDYLGEPQGKGYEFQVLGDTLSTTSIDLSFTEEYQFKPGSREDVLAREKVAPDLVGTWGRSIVFSGKAEYTFRPGGYYFLKNTLEDSQFPPEYIRGRYEQDGNQLILEPYSGVPAEYEIDFFGTSLTLIKSDGTSGQSEGYEALPGSAQEVRTKAAEAEAFLEQANWQVGVWEIREDFETIDVTFRPDGHYIAKHDTEFLEGIVRGRYALEAGQLDLFPFPGQGLYARSNGEFGKAEQWRQLDYYDGELQIIDLGALSQSVTIARKRPGSETGVLERVEEAETERAREGWHIGTWEVNDPEGWMAFTFRPDNRYIAQSGAHGAPTQAERGQYVMKAGKLTLAPYSGQGPARAFEMDLYEGDLFLVGDANRMVVARKLADSEATVIEKTGDPEATKGERGTILGLWTANLPGETSELVFRPDGEFRLNRCSNEQLSRDYGLYTVNMATRTLVSDSRFRPVETLGLDFYGNTMTIFGGLSSPRTYVVNLGTVDQAIEDSLQADAQEAQIDAQWLARAPIGPRDPNAVQSPTGDIPADPFPDRIFTEPTVLANYHLYRRLILGVVYFNEQGTLKSVDVVNTREWHFFPTGRVMVRFKDYHAGPFYPMTIPEVTTMWGAYRIEPKPNQRDILHVYADNVVFLETDLGEQSEMTLEDGRRNLFLGKDFQLLSEWATEQTPIPCDEANDTEPSLMNTGLSLATTIEPDEISDSGLIQLKITGPVAGSYTLSGTSGAAGDLVIERAADLASPVAWIPLQTNSLSAGPFSFQVPQGNTPAAYFRLRGL